MARITVEDCLEHVENRFVLVIEASKRARELSLTTAEAMVPEDNDKPTVVALREIAAGLFSRDRKQPEQDDVLQSETPAADTVADAEGEDL